MNRSHSTREGLRMNIAGTQCISTFISNKIEKAEYSFGLYRALMKCYHPKENLSISHPHFTFLATLYKYFHLRPD